jgi:MFS family permease
MKKIVMSLSFIVALRFFGLFLVMPLLSVYAASKVGANNFLIGVVVGGYALSQLIFQLPFGLLSDKFNRKALASIGLAIFAVGSIIYAYRFQPCGVYRVSLDVLRLRAGRGQGAP